MVSITTTVDKGCYDQLSYWRIVVLELIVTKVVLRFLVAFRKNLAIRGKESEEIRFYKRERDGRLCKRSEQSRKRS